MLLNYELTKGETKATISRVATLIKSKDTRSIRRSVLLSISIFFTFVFYFFPDFPGAKVLF
ncbi:MAG: hypothetical protein A2319_05035 [Candidatus Kerfeldbacteria bacterium RIFOXYB2_FULL_38_14]|uniref:Uncharacterized protein n=1 Tax=Candidatus Kerfeldbacteria bacterium RIFOXYB2_FULL_38_14 TaxID=1798547 RepID=A0A1G2BGG2_9BACT|nr:MAG: hypothetical protein A2319_05035 [Candidatus Kerfeldbacteria bacterium RIFOXYB2_FULL_38_14]